MLWKDINMIDMLIRNPGHAFIFAVLIVGVIGLVWISPKSGTGPG